MPGFFDDNTSRYISDKTVKHEYELDEHEKKSVEEIKNRLRQKKYREKSEILDAIEFLENLNQKIGDILKNEANAGNDNWTLKVAQEEVFELFQQLRQEYKRM
ncbi:hypothetical protein HYU11_03445 [Candidatus Woesearchaeota archaeon]|nr:hypothetical protein [Candidatus Woesearchaeota archaeon]